MNLAYSAFKTTLNNSSLNYPNRKNETLIRYRAYQETCDKYAREIIAIQKYIPGWRPKFR